MAVRVCRVTPEGADEAPSSGLILYIFVLPCDFLRLGLKRIFSLFLI